MEEKKISEIDIIYLVQIILGKWRLLSRFIIVGGLLGLIVAFSIPKSFSSSVILAPEFSSGSSGLSSSLSDLASSFGVNLNSSKSTMDAIYPDLYPDIFESTDFVQSLYDVPVRLLKDSRVRTYLTHLQQDVRIPWWNYPRIWLGKCLKPTEPILNSKKGAIDPYAMNHTQWEIYKEISSSISCIVDKKTSVITISVTDQDPMVAAIMADTLQIRLQEYITNYRTNKSRRDVEHYKQLTAQAKEAYEKVRRKYVTSSDANTDVTLMAVTARTEDLENDMQLKYNVYTQSMAQLKLAEAKLQERTPAFTIIQPAKVTPKPVSMPKIVILLIWSFLGMLVGAIYILFHEHKQKLLK